MPFCTTHFDKMKKCTKSMINTHRGKQTTRQVQNKGYGEEKRVPTLKIKLGPEPKVVPSSYEDNSSYLDSEINIGGFNTTIADKVKLRKRGRNSTSDAELYKSISQSSLPEKKRKRKSSSACMSSGLCSSSSSSPINSPPSIEPSKIMSQSDCEKSLVSNLTFDSRSTLGDTLVAHIDAGNSDLPSKKAKLLECYPTVTEEKPSTTSDLVDIHQLEVASYEEVTTFEFEVASYEEVSTVEALSTSSAHIPPEVLDINDVDNNIPASSMLQETNSISLPKDQHELVFNTRKTNCIHSEVCRNNQKNGAADVSPRHLDYASMMIKSIQKESDQNGFKTVDSSVVEEFFSHEKELLMAQKRTDDHVNKMTDLAIEIEKQPGFQGFSDKVNAMVKNYNSVDDVLDALKLSIQTRNHQYIPGLKTRIISKDSVKIVPKPISRFSAGPSLNSNTHARDYKITHVNNAVFKLNNHSTKEKRKAMDERCIVYVGNIPHDYTVSQLKKRFQRFGAIRNIQIKSKSRGDLNSFDGHSLVSEEMRNYGFITFSCNQEASDAIEGGNRGHELQFHLSFGARRQFVGEEYKDLDGIVAKNENSMYKQNSRSSFLPQNKEDDFDIILQNAMKARGVKPQPFRMKCKA